MPKSSTFLRNFCKFVKIFHFSREIIFGQLFIDIWRFFSGHTAHHPSLSKVQNRRLKWKSLSCWSVRWKENLSWRKLVFSFLFSVSVSFVWKDLKQKAVINEGHKGRKEERMNGSDRYPQIADFKNGSQHCQTFCPN